MCEQLVAIQVGDHPPSALRDVRLVGGWSMSAQDREQPVFARLRQVQLLGFLSCRGDCGRNVLHLAKTPCGGVVARLLAFPHSL